VTALAMVLTLGPAERFASGRKVGSYFGLIPSEHSSGGRQQFGTHQQAGQFVSALLAGGAGQIGAARYDAELGRFYRRLAVRKHRGLAKVAVARKLATRLYRMLRENWNYAQLCKGRCAGEPESFCGGKTETERLSGQLPPDERGVRSSNAGARTEEMDGETLCPPRD